MKYNDTLELLKKIPVRYTFFYFIITVIAIIVMFITPSIIILFIIAAILEFCLAIPLYILDLKIIDKTYYQLLILNNKKVKIENNQALCSNKNKLISFLKQKRESLLNNNSKDKNKTKNKTYKN